MMANILLTEMRLFMNKLYLIKIEIIYYLQNTYIWKKGKSLNILIFGYCK